MNQLMQNKVSTMTSIEFLDAVINPFRLKEGETPHEPRKFLAKIIDELDLDETGKKIRLNSNQTESAYYILDKDQMMLVGMRESKGVRKNVLEWIKLATEDQKPAIPQTYAEALLEAGRLALENEKQAEQLRLAAPKVEFVDRFTQRESLQNATQVAQTMGMSAVKMNRALDEFGGVYNKSVKRSRAFCQEWIDSGCGRMIQNDIGHPQAMFTTSGVARVTEIFISEGII